MTLTTIIYHTIPSRHCIIPAPIVAWSFMHYEAFEQLSKGSLNFAMYGCCHEMHISCPALQCARALFDALVWPITSYCFELWMMLGGKVAMLQLEQCTYRSCANFLECQPRAPWPHVHNILEKFLQMRGVLNRSVHFEMQSGLRLFAGIKDELCLHVIDKCIPKSVTGAMAAGVHGETLPGGPWSEAMLYMHQLCRGRSSQAPC